MERVALTFAAPIRQSRVLQTAVVLFVLLLASQAWRWASITGLMLVLAVGSGLLILLKPQVGPLGVVLAALLANREIETGTEVLLNPVTYLVPILFALWLLVMALRKRIRLLPSRTTRPLVLFLMASLFSLLLGRATWDPSVPIRSNFLLVQLAQLGIFVFSAFAFWLAGNQLHNERWLRRLTQTFLIAGGVLAIVMAILGVGAVFGPISTAATLRAPFWILLAGLAGGQLLFVRDLSPLWRAFLVAVLIAVLFYALRLQQEAVSNWVGVVAVAGALIWLRWPRLRWPILLAILSLAVLGVLFPAVYGFAGGDAEWQLSGGSRLLLMERVIDVTMRNPITGLGPAAYRPYTTVTPLQYGSALWISPLINSHNNYVDLFAHTGLLGLGLFLWFMVEVVLLARRLVRSYQHGFAAGYVNGMLAIWAGIMVVMLLLDWFLPFVYNVGFRGFQASVLVWLFLGGLVAIENWGAEELGADRVSGSMAKGKENAWYG